MKFIRNIFIALYIFLSLFCTNSTLAADYSKHTETSAITSYKFFENDLINEKNNDFSITAITQNTNLSLSNRLNSSSGSNSNQTALISSQRKSLEEYIYHQSYLANKQKTALLPFLAQIQPNAP